MNRNIYSNYVCYLLLFFILPSYAYSKGFYIRPYLQSPTDTSINIVFEMRSPKAMNIKWGESPDQLEFTQKILPKKFKRSGRSHRLYISHLQGLKPKTKYFYKITSLDFNSEVYSFKTYPTKSGSFAFLAMSDAQHGNSITKKQINESVIMHAFSQYLDNSQYPVRFSLFAGDLVQRGYFKSKWKKEFFGPMQSLLSRVPVYPALGNHEDDSSHYFDYFVLPRNGSLGFKEHWYFFDHGNTRFITLDTNSKYRVVEQLLWLERTLKDAEKNPEIDFVITQFHHPHKSELWLDGETAYSGKIERQLINFSKRSKKPSLYFCGHTHGYSRGHSFEANHTMMVIGSIGGAIDDWGDYDQRDYKEYTKSLDKFGWMLGQVTVGEKPEILLKRYSFGNDAYQSDEGVADIFKIKRYNKPPNKPIVKGVLKKASKIHINLAPFKDPDHDTHLTTHLQVIGKFGKKQNFYFQKENWFEGKNKNRGKKLTEIVFNYNKAMKKNVKIRYRDSSLAWSEWIETSIKF